MNFQQFLNEQILQNQQNTFPAPQEIDKNIQQQEQVKSEIDTSSDEESMMEDYFSEKPQYKTVYEELYEKLKTNNPPSTQLESEQLQMIAELQAKVIVQETEYFILKKMNQDLKSRQSKQSTQLEVLQKERDVRIQVFLLNIQMKIGFDKKFQKLEEKRKVLETTQKTIKKLANTTPKDYMQSALQRVNSTVKINENPLPSIPPQKNVTQLARKSSQLLVRQNSIIKKKT